MEDILLARPAPPRLLGLFFQRLAARRSAAEVVMYVELRLSRSPIFGGLLRPKIGNGSGLMHWIHEFLHILVTSENACIETSAYHVFASQIRVIGKGYGCWCNCQARALQFTYINITQPFIWNSGYMLFLKQHQGNILSLSVWRQQSGGP